MSKKIFISQPMNGLSDEEILEVKAQAVHDITRRTMDGRLPKDILVLSTFIEEDFPEALFASKSGLWYLGRSLQMLAEADYIYMCPGWEAARGCIVENLAAKLYGIEEVKG